MNVAANSDDLVLMVSDMLLATIALFSKIMRRGFTQITSVILLATIDAIREIMERFLHRLHS